MSTIEDKVRQIVVSTVKGEMHNWERRNGWRLDALGEQVAVLEQRADQSLTADHYLALDARSEDLRTRVERLEETRAPILHERDGRGNWICCCGDHLEEPPPLREP